MQPLEPPDLHYASAAIGWLELGNLAEARVELARISSGLRQHPDVLEIQWILCAREERWDEGLQIARALLHAAPDRCSGWLHQAYALRRVREGTVKKAWHALLPAFDKFPRNALICFNLACYACQMQQLDAARVWFNRALVLGGKEQIKTMALQDSDLQALWAEIQQS